MTVNQVNRFSILLSSSIFSRSSTKFILLLISLMMGMGLICVPQFGTVAEATVTKVGNGDDGSDLEGFERVESGPLQDARRVAIEKLKKLNVDGIEGLGFLIPEVERTVFYRAKRDVQAKLEDESGHSDLRGLVFARTFAEPHAATRFFPVAEKLDQDQLVALQIHEGLHRALPAAIREDEKKVAALTLSITAPEATFDRVKQVAQQQMPFRLENQAAIASSGSSRAPLPEDASIRRPSTFSYGYTYFTQNPDLSESNISGVHSIQSFMYPFGSDENPIGVGIELSFVTTENQNHLGPLGLSGRARLWSARGFDVGAWASAHLSALSSDDLKNSRYGRDLYSVGLSLRKEDSRFYLENTLGWTIPSKAEQKIGSVNYQYEYGSVFDATVRVGAKFGIFRLGGYGQVLLSDYYRINGGAFSGYDSGRYKLVSVGPTLTASYQNYSFEVFGKKIITATRDANFEYVGNLLGEGTGQAAVGARFSLQF